MSLVTINIAGSDYISYASVAEADQYLVIDMTRADSWFALSSGEKEVYLLYATRLLDTLFYIGHKTDISQNNEWPRTNVVTSYGLNIASDIVPVELQNATILLAGTLVMGKANSDQKTDINIRRVKAGSAEIEYFRPGQQRNKVAFLDKTAYDLLFNNGLLSYVSSENTGACASGTDTKSSLSSNYGLKRGFS